MPRALTKERARLHERDREWLPDSPFCPNATPDADGACGVELADLEPANPALVVARAGGSVWGGAAAGTSLASSAACVWNGIAASFSAKAMTRMTTRSTNVTGG